MNEEALYRREGGLFVPAKTAASPWASDQQHGGPVLGLVAHAAESHVADPSLQPMRLSVDLFRAVPLSPIEVQATTIHSGGRIELVQVSLLAEGSLVSRANVLFLRGTKARGFESDEEAVRGPEDLETTSMIPPELWDRIRPGFHTHVEVRWETNPRDPDPIFWARVPGKLVAGEAWSPFQRAASISDLANATASVRRMAAHPEGSTFINPDCSLYLSRLPEGELIRLRCDRISDRDGIGIGEVVHHDVHGRFGRTLQVRLAHLHPQAAFGEPT